MSTKLLLCCGLLGALTLACPLLQAQSNPEYERVSLNALPRVLYGQWKDPKSGDEYRFLGNKTYIFQAGAEKNKSGNLSHSGTWNTSGLVSETFPAFGPFELRLNATSRRIKRDGQIVTRAAHRRFELPCRLDYPDVPPTGTQIYLSKNGRYYYREPNNPQNVHWLTPSPETKKDRLFIGSTVFVRVK